MNLTAAERSHAVIHVTGTECAARPVVRMLAVAARSVRRAGEDLGDLGYKNGYNRIKALARSRSALRGLVKDVAHH